MLPSGHRSPHQKSTTTITKLSVYHTVFNTSESTTLTQNAIQVFLSPAKTQRFTHNQENIPSTFGQENIITKIPEKIKCFFKNKRDLGVFIGIFLLQKPASWYDTEMQFIYIKNFSSNAEQGIKHHWHSLAGCLPKHFLNKRSFI